MSKCIGSYLASEVGELTLFHHELTRGLHPKDGDRIVIESHPRHRTITISINPSKIEQKRQTAKLVIKDLQRIYPNCFRTRREENKTTTTFWPNGYPGKIAEETTTSPSYEGEASTHPNDEYVHIIGKAISYIRAYEAYCKTDEGLYTGLFDYELNELLH